MTIDLIRNALLTVPAHHDIGNQVRTYARENNATKMVEAVQQLRSQAKDDYPSMLDLLGLYAFDKLIAPDTLPITLDQVELEEELIKY